MNSNDNLAAETNSKVVSKLLCLTYSYGILSNSNTDITATGSRVVIPNLLPLLNNIERDELTNSNINSSLQRLIDEQSMNNNENNNRSNLLALIEYFIEVNYK
jgi:hypothetical protein